MYKRGDCSPWCRSLPLCSTHLGGVLCFLSCLSLQPVSLVWDRKVNREAGADGVQLRRHRGGGRQVPRAPPPPPQHDADRRGGVAIAQDDAEELVVRLVRPQPQPRPRPRRRAQVRVCAGHARRLLQVPPPPQQLPRPRPPGVPSLPGHLRRTAAGRGPVLLPHRRGAVTAPVSVNQETPAQQQQRGEEKRETEKRRTDSLSLM